VLGQAPCFAVVASLVEQLMPSTVVLLGQCLLHVSQDSKHTGSRAQRVRQLEAASSRLLLTLGLSCKTRVALAALHGLALVCQTHEGFDQS